MKTNTKKITLIGVLAAMSAILYLFPTFPVIPAFNWLEIDFADVPALFASVAVSPVAGGVIVLIRNTIHLAVSSTAMIGELSNFLISFTFVVFTGLIYRLFGVRKCGFDVKKAIASVSCGAAFQIIAAVLVNYFVMVPMYSAFIDFDSIGGAGLYIYAGVLPFNAIKDVIAATIFVIVGRYIYPSLQRVMKI